MSSSQTQQSAASAAVGGKTARACDGCLRRRARWYCAADDAFLCQNCDSSIHSANPLARRHERLRLKPASPRSPPLLIAKHEELSAPVWLKGFKRKARTPRPHHHPKLGAVGHVSDVRTPVPDLVENHEEEEDKEEEEEEEQQLLYRVPIFDPVLAEFCSPPPNGGPNASGEDMKPAVQLLPDNTQMLASRIAATTADGVTGFVPPSDMELAEFATDMETLLRQGLDDGGDSFSMENLGLLDVRKGDDSTGGCATESSGDQMKLEQDDNHPDMCHLGLELDVSRESTLDIDFDCGSPLTGGEDGAAADKAAGDRGVKLRLDYEAIIATWSRSPWTDGERPQLSLDDCRSDFMGMWIGGGGGSGHMNRGQNGGMGYGEGAREARVTRYREKRRTRLFSKKIRYEVRKLNAEKRPRMKGRFVKRASFATTVPGSGPTLAF